ncbi:MAG: energy-coupled thiamine transporter ThiT [Oscillospiraceae bacterium]|nr:energy-coupled thiamine transporter ThiT [Oscillospiraceae bacterium]
MRINNKTRRLSECAVMIALSTVLSMICIYQAPYGGKVTLGSMVPIIIVCAHIKDFRWGLLACFVYSLVQMLLGFAAPPTATIGYFAAVVLLDYIVAFTVLCIVNPISKIFGNTLAGVAVGTVIAMLCRFMCHFITGILIWGVYAPEGQPVWLYSLIYNGGYMIPEAVITVSLSSVIFAVLKKRVNIN